MPGARYGAKWDESDFAFHIEETSATPEPGFTVENGRVLDTPKKRKSISIGRGHTKSVVICIHRVLVTQRCSLCEYETRVLTGRSR